MKSILWNIIVETSRRASFFRRIMLLTFVGTAIQSVTANAQESSKMSPVLHPCPQRLNLPIAR
ncbi:MAG: hypothetical protein IPP19_15245 [Verrucomicrobia bacterium]|nr:hypothetical protein [Verrucomicrobiota bacterium]